MVTQKQPFCVLDQNVTFNLLILYLPWFLHLFFFFFFIETFPFLIICHISDSVMTARLRKNELDNILDDAGHPPARK